MAATAVHSGFVTSLHAPAFVDTIWHFQPLVGSSKVPLGVAPERSDPHPGVEEYNNPSLDRSMSSSSFGSSSSGVNSSRSTCSRSLSSSSCRTCSEDGGEESKYLDFAPEASEIRRVFDKFDENNDGHICAKDLHRFMKRLGFEMSEEETASMLESVDHNNDDKLDFDEFYSLYKSLTTDEEATEIEVQEAEDEDEILLQAFKVFDKNEDGVITAQELQTVLLDLGLLEGKSLRSCERMIQRVDSDGNGEIDIYEFKTMMCSKCFQL